MTVEVGTLSKIVNKVFKGRPARLAEKMVYQASIYGTDYSRLKSEDELWKKMRDYLAKGADPNGRSLVNDTAIETLCDEGHHATALKLLEEYPGLKVNTRHKAVAISPLMYALRDAHPGLVKALCEHGADVNKTVTGLSDPVSPLEFLLSAGKGKEAEAAACMKTLLDYGLVPTDAAKRRIFSNHQALARFLPDVQQAVDFHAALDKGDNVTLRKMLENGVQHTAGENFGALPALHKAAAAGNLDAIDLLLAHGADIEKGGTVTSAPALHHAALHGQRDACIKLLDAGAKYDLLLMKCQNGTMANLDTSIKCPDPGMQDFLKELLSMRKTSAPCVELAKPVKRIKTLRLKPRST